MNPRHRGIFLLDALFGTMIAVTVTTSVVVVVAAQQRGTSRLAQSRADVRTLESALFLLQAGRPPRAGVVTQTIDKAPAPAGWIWVEVTTGVAPHTASLRGLVPAQGGTK